MVCPMCPVRVAFVGRASRHAVAAVHDRTAALRPVFLDTGELRGPGELRRALGSVAPGVVVVLEPDAAVVQAVDGLRAVTLGVLTQAFPQPSEWHAGEGTAYDWLDPGAFDRLVACDPLLGDALAERLPVWRSRPLPVDDRLYAPVPAAARRPPRAVFIGASTPERERTLVDSKHRFDLVHYAHGLHGERLRDVLRTVDVGVNAHADGAGRFAHRALVHLAAGQLLLSQPLDPLHGLEPEIDFVEFSRSDELVTLLGQLARRPDMYERVRLRGRAKAEEHRASRVWARVVDDLLADVAAFG